MIYYVYDKILKIISSEIKQNKFELKLSFRKDESTVSIKKLSNTLYRDNVTLMVSLQVNKSIILTLNMLTKNNGIEFRPEGAVR